MDSSGSVHTHAHHLARELLAAFSATQGCEAHLSDEGGCVFTVGDALDIHFHVVPEREAAYVYCVIGALRLTARAESLIALLAANHQWEAGEGATLALDEDLLTLERLVPLQELDAHSLGLLLSRTVLIVNRLRNEHAQLLVDGHLQPSSFV